MTDEHPEPEPDEAPDEAEHRQLTELDAVRAADAAIMEHVGDLVDKMRDLTGEDEAPRVKAFGNIALIAIAERVYRIMRRDLPADQA